MIQQSFNVYMVYASVHNAMRMLKHSHGCGLTSAVLQCRWVGHSTMWCLTAHGVLYYIYWIANDELRQALSIQCYNTPPYHRTMLFPGLLELALAMGTDALHFIQKVSLSTSMHIENTLTLVVMVVSFQAHVQTTARIKNYVIMAAPIVPITNTYIGTYIRYIYIYSKYSAQYVEHFSFHLHFSRDGEHRDCACMQFLG